MLCGSGIALKIYRAGSHLKGVIQLTLNRGEMIMRVLLSLIALFGVIAIADIALSPNASATY